MSEIKDQSIPTPPAGGISDMARSLAATLQAAPAREARAAAALRHCLIKAARELADLVDRPHADLDMSSAHGLVEWIRHIAADLDTTPPAVPTGIGVVLQAFAADLLPATLLILRPAGHFHYSFFEELSFFNSLAEQLRLKTTGTDPDLPREMLVLRYPQGEQDNVLLCCNLLSGFRPRSDGQNVERSDTFATWLLGPAYFFAFAAEVERAGSSSRTDTLPRLCLVSDLLKETGWFAHPQIGPLLLEARERLGFHDRYVEEHAGPPDPTAMEALQRERETGVSQYLPADFDRDVPRLWDRLRQLLPPNDLELDSVESVQPADAVSILNAGWSFALLHMEDLYHILGSRTAEDRYEAGQVLNRLLTKGIELSHIARLWRQARD